VARANVSGLGRPAARVTVAEGRTVDVVVSNPPYIAADEELPPSVEVWEPASALIAGPAGTEDLVHLIDTAPDWLAPGGALVLELAPHQAGAMAGHAEAAGYVEVRVEADLAGLDRCVVARRPERG
jgi:release factor glutamine methyltransferase